MHRIQAKADFVIWYYEGKRERVKKKKIKAKTNTKGDRIGLPQINNARLM